MTQQQYIELSQSLAGWALDLVETIECHCTDDRMVIFPEFKQTKARARELLGETIEQKLGG